MYFSEYFEVEPELLQSYGTVDIPLICDVPFFVDPMLIFNSDKPEYQELHRSIIRYFHFLYEKSKDNQSDGALGAWFRFSEVPNNWLGYSLSGNKGLALGRDYAEFLFKNIGFAIETSGISKSEHLEKAMLLYPGSGKDKISDLTVNLIKGYLCRHTETFAKSHIDESYCAEFDVERTSFSYTTESFVSSTFHLPFIVDAKGNLEFVLLTPKDILRSDEPSINRNHMLKNHERIRRSIENDELRAVVNNYMAKAVHKYEEEQKRQRKKPRERAIKSIEKSAFEDMLVQYPVLYDYYIALREEDTDEIRSLSNEEFISQNARYIEASKKLIEQFNQGAYAYDESLSAAEEAKRRLLFFKHELEDCDGYKSLYINGEVVAREDQLQRFWRLVWYGTSYKLDAEANNGRGNTDFIISKGLYNQNIVEFKLASNTQLPHVFTQVKIYEAANCAEGSLIAVFFFSEQEEKRARAVIHAAGYEDYIDASIFLIDCRDDNKPSASTAR